jgi:hypothetical protein
MTRGARAWLADLEERGGPRRGVALLTLTNAHDTRGQLRRDDVRRFFFNLQRKYGKHPYFCWTELTKRGRLHYHALISDLPYIPRKQLRRIDSLWKKGSTRVQWRDRNWFIKGAAQEYVIGYAKKIGSKAYQQAYEDLPPSIRTFSCSRIRTASGRVARAPRWAIAECERRGFRVLDARRRIRGGGWRLEIVDPQDIRPFVEYAELWLLARPAYALKHYFPPGKMILAVQGISWQTVAGEHRNSHASQGRRQGERAKGSLARHCAPIRPSPIGRSGAEDRAERG